MKRISITVIIIWLLISLSSAVSQTEAEQDRNTYIFKHKFVNHPDGVTGKLSTQISASYLNIKNQFGDPIIDAQEFQLGLGWVLKEKLTIRQSFTTIKKYQTTYKLSFGLSYYISNPVHNSALVNPDGKLGSPIILLDTDILLDDYKETKTNINYKSQILFPFTKSLSIFGGYTAYDEIRTQDVETFFGGIHFFLSSYKNSQNYSNPDAPLFGMAISFSGGASEFGNFGQIDLAVPSSNTVTFTLSARGNFIEAPHNKSYSASLKVDYYTGK